MKEENPSRSKHLVCISQFRTIIQLRENTQNNNDVSSNMNKKFSSNATQFNLNENKWVKEKAFKYTSNIYKRKRS